MSWKLGCARTFPAPTTPIIIMRHQRLINPAQFREANLKTQDAIFENLTVARAPGRSAGC
jgi:hypothetical protein